jgi:hypothetical protein
MIIFGLFFEMNFEGKSSAEVLEVVRVVARLRLDEDLLVLPPEVVAGRRTRSFTRKA